MKKYILKKITENEQVIERLKIENEELKQQAQQSDKRRGIEKWIDFTFESSSMLTEEFAQFAKEFKKHIKDTIGNEYELLNWNRGHFEISGFAKNKATGKLAYLSYSDVRYWKNSWYNNLLVRTAKNEMDYTGGSNHYYSLPQLSEAIDQLTS